MNTSELLLALIVFIGCLVLFTKTVRATANLLDRFAKALRTWAANKENRK